jgi:hypothetical protein
MSACDVRSRSAPCQRESRSRAKQASSLWLPLTALEIITEPLIVSCHGFASPHDSSSPEGVASYATPAYQH